MVAPPGEAVLISVIEKIERINVVIGSISGVGTMLMILAIVPDIVARAGFRVALHGVGELCTALLVILIFCGLAGAQARDAHFRVSTMETLLAGTRGLRVLKFLGLLLAIVVFAWITWVTGVTASRSYRQGEMAVGVASFPVWPQRFFVCVGFALLTVQLALDLMRLSLGAERSGANVKGD